MARGAAFEEFFRRPDGRMKLTRGDPSIVSLVARRGRAWQLVRGR